MNRRLVSILSLALVPGMLVVGQSPVEGQPASPGPEDSEVLARGPIHEAFAEPTAAETATPPVAPKQLPEPIDEWPPEMKPANGNCSWIPGYWNWDAEAIDLQSKS